MTDRPAVLLRFTSKDGRQANTRTKSHTVWAKTHEVTRSPYVQWGGRVYALWEFPSEGALIAFRLEDGLWDAVFNTPYPIDLWCRINEAEQARADFVRAIEHDYGHNAYVTLARRISWITKKKPVAGYIDEPWDVSVSNLTAIFGSQERFIKIANGVNPDGTRWSSVRTDGMSI